jgi:hypothetical protein
VTRASVLRGQPQDHIAVALALPTQATHCVHHKLVEVNKIAALNVALRTLRQGRFDGLVSGRADSESDHGAGLYQLGRDFSVHKCALRQGPHHEAPRRAKAA